MPFTPFHMGPALLLKPVLDRRFSLIVFGTAQVCMDIEPGIGMLRGSAVLHGYSHTLAGATVIAFFAAIIGRMLATLVLSRWNAEVKHYRFFHLTESIPISWPVALGSAFFGTLSHLLLDALMHADMQPFFPFSNSNHLLFAVPVMHVYLVTFIAGAFGVIIWLGRAIWMRKDSRLQARQSE